MIILRNKSYSEREKVPDDILEKAKKEGVVQKDHQGRWRIVSIQKKEFWDAIYPSKERGREALAAFHIHKH
jgi:hypothetical protein